MIHRMIFFYLIIVLYVEYFALHVLVALHHLDDDANATQAYEQAVKLDS